MKVEKAEETEYRTNEAKALTPKKNIEIMRGLVKDWHLGPAVAYDNNQKNAPYWRKLGAVMGMDEAAARRLSCASCRYGNIQPKYLKAMEHIPYNKFDKDGGMRVWCEKFDFICHANRVCQAWEEGY